MPTDYHELVRRHPLYAVHDDVACANAMEMIHGLTSIGRPTNGQLKYLEALSTLVEAYEKSRFFVGETPTPLELLRDLMERRGMSASELGRLLGDRAPGPRIMNGERDLSKAHIRKLSEYFCVDPGLFLAA